MTMTRTIHVGLAALAAAFLAASSAFAAAPAEQVQEMLKRVYPEAQTRITGERQVNGVKVSEVQVKTDAGESTAQITEHGDFLIYGAPQQSRELRSLIEENATGLFKGRPQNIQSFRTTNYWVDVPSGQSQPYRVRLDAVGRVLDIETPTEMKGGGARRGLEEVSGDEAEKIKELARKFVPNVQGTDGVYKARQGGEYFLVDFHEGAEAIVSADGRMFSFRRPIDGSDLPVPVKQTVDQMFTQTTRAYKGEDVLFQFDQKSPAGNAVTIRMRPNGEVVQVINEAAEADEKAVTAGAKESEPAAPAQRSSD